MTTERYNPAAAEPKWQAVWQERESFRAVEDPARPKYYVLEMFPYPSGRIHMGHVRNYAMGDVLARYLRARGFNVLHPMGWDAFGMPAENAAIERGVHPRSWTYDNIATMRRQLKSMGLSLDWSREIATCDPAYYRHEQAMFVDFMAAGLVERTYRHGQLGPGRSHRARQRAGDRRPRLALRRPGREARAGPVVSQDHRLFPTSCSMPWTGSTGWPEKVRLMQRNWIGRSEGLRLAFDLVDGEGRPLPDKLVVYTTRHDTIFGATFCALSADHPLTRAEAERRPEIARFRRECAALGTSEEAIERAEKQGLPLELFARPSLPRGRAASGLCRQFRADGLWRGRHIRLPGP